MIDRWLTRVLGKYLTVALLIAGTISWTLRAFGEHRHHRKGRCSRDA